MSSSEIATNTRYQQCATSYKSLEVRTIYEAKERRNEDDITKPIVKSSRNTGKHMAQERIKIQAS
ncbi:hypothetical protein J6TS7_25980 [Paenibacillus dendritiformis]|nr:hypothetical protein J6TS7_25980 [Paenibacillus dendritiformis]